MHDQPHQFEPLLPSTAEVEKRGLPTLSARIVEQAMRLRTMWHGSALVALREVVRGMNSYYSNLIEGQSTHPKSIDAALHKDFSAEPEIARRQRVAVAHIEAERELETTMRASGLGADAALTSAWLIAAHRALYSRLSAADRMTGDGLPVEPGELRQRDVLVGRHVPPAAASIPRFLERLDEVYPKATRDPTAQLIAIAAAHHRAAWVHPFMDGNGRAVRLQTHCALFPITGGLWSASRALARNRAAYYARLDAADQPRLGDLDGRGNLTERGLLDWCELFVKLCADQVQFMNELLDLENLKRRFNFMIAARCAEGLLQYRPQLVLPLLHVVALGPVSRGEFKQMTGLNDRTAQASLAQLLSDGLLRSDSPKGAVSFGLPLGALEYLFPRLYPEAQLPIETAPETADERRFAP